MTLSIANNNEIKQALSNPSFVLFAKKTGVPYPQESKHSFGFESVIDETAFIMAYKGFVTGVKFALSNIERTKSMSVNTKFDSVKEATENLFFMHEARKQELPLPVCSFADYSKFTFSDNIDELSFKMFYAGWRSALNMSILHYNNELAVA